MKGSEIRRVYAERFLYRLSFLSVSRRVAYVKMKGIFNLRYLWNYECFKFHLDADVTNISYELQIDIVGVMQPQWNTYGTFKKIPLYDCIRFSVLLLWAAVTSLWRAMALV